MGWQIDADHEIKPEVNKTDCGGAAHSFKLLEKGEEEGQAHSSDTSLSTQNQTSLSLIYQCHYSLLPSCIQAPLSKNLLVLTQ